MKHTRNFEKGQMLLIVILVMVVALTIGLSVVTRTITNVRTTNEEESSQRAFSAAEAGVEKALNLSAGSTINANFSNNAQYTTTVGTLSSSEFLLNNGFPVAKDDFVDIWLSEYPTYSPQWAGGNLTVFWGSANPVDVCTNNEATNTMAAIEFILISGTVNNPQITHQTFDPCGSRAAFNHFTPVVPLPGTVAGKNFNFQHTIVIPAGTGLIARVVPLYAQTSIGVRGDSTLPSQGTIITSVGSVQGTSPTDKVQRKIVTFRSYPKVPIELFPFVIFSPN